MLYLESICCKLVPPSSSSLDSETGPNSYPPTPVHLSMLLSMLRLPINGEDTLELDANPKTTRLAIPGLVILHEPSRYFASAVDQ